MSNPAGFPLAWPNSAAFASMPYASGVATWLSDSQTGMDRCAEQWTAFMAGTGTVRAYMASPDNGGGVVEFTGPLNDIVIHSMQVCVINTLATPFRLFVCFSIHPQATFVHPPGWPTEPQ